MTTASAAATELGFGALEPIVASFEAAAREAPGIEERDFMLAGAEVRFRSPHSEMLGTLCRAFAHLELAEPAARPQLVVDLWDGASGGPVPPLPSERDQKAPGAFFYFSSDRLRAGFQAGTSGDPRVLAIHPEVTRPPLDPMERLTVLERSNTHGWYWVADAARIPYWEQASPLLFLFDWWLRDRNMHLLHAAAVGVPAGGILLVGKSGSGKSTAALSSLASDLLYAGDDYVCVSLDPHPHVHGLYNTGKLMQDHVERLPFVLDGLANRDRLTEKAVVYVNESWPARLTPGFPLRALMIPRVTPGLVEARATETSPAAGLRALAPSTVLQMHTRGQDSLARVRRLLERVPTYTLELGSDMVSIPRTIHELIQSLNDG
ncbi:MAG TPA: hypothetical protein VFU33_12575 [Gaiellaceae bacterium]|nr:hypothetical protein [Gaiellaceae bacterium]